MSSAYDFYNADDARRWGREELPDAVRRTAEWIDRLSLPDGPIVELGCGKGAASRVSPRWTGLDFSFRALTMIGERQANAAHSPRRVNADMQRLPFRDRSVAFAFSWAALEHVPDPLLVIEELDRVIAPGGAVLLAPAWHCRSWAADGLEFRPYSELRTTQRIRKALIPLRNNVLWRALFELPSRLIAESRLGAEKRPLPYRFGKLVPNLDEYVGTDCDAFTSLDPHATLAWFLSRGWSSPSHATRGARLKARSEPIVVIKRA
jgi:SAM-dependent methyltransferase